MRYFASLLLVLVFAVSAGAVEFGRFQQADTRYGRVEVRAVSSFAKTVIFNGQPLPQINTASVHILGAFRAEGAEQDWVILSLASGGNACAAELVILRAAPDGLTMTPPFGDCSDQIEALRVFPDRIELDVPVSALFVQGHRYRFDGRQFTYTEVRRPVAQAPVGGSGAAQWVGRHPAMLMRSPAEQARLLRVMGRSDLEDLYRSVSGPGETSQIGDWVVGTACQRHQCNARRGIIAIRATDGQVRAGIGAGPGNTRVFGGDYRSLPAAVRAAFDRTFAAGIGARP
ncbi:MAG: hypothetical protein AAF848_12245 [Pseudomonadota bacterium]